MAHKLLVQVVFTGARVFGRAFTEAYKEAAAASASTAQKGGKDGKKTASSSQSRDSDISLDEATKILDVDLSGLTLEKAQGKYDYLFGTNAKEKGGSFYVQSKVYRSLERIKHELDYLEELQQKEGGEDHPKAEEKKKE